MLSCCSPSVSIVAVASIARSAAMVEPVVLVHGGAGDIPDERVQPKLDGVRAAVKAGYNSLAASGSVLDAVVAAVHIMEDDEAFNAGRGSVLNTDGEVEMDAIIMDGKDLQTGAVGAIKNVQHPIDVARLVMEKTPHSLLVADGAKRFANDMGVPEYPQGKLITQFAIDALERVKKLGDHTVSEIGWTGGVGTVGAVAIDAQGHLAVATSTGGTSGKMPGRVGDTALCGCGGYSDDRVGTVSTTGHGESIIKVNLARDILTRMEQGRTAEEATIEACENLSKRVGNSAGAITLSRLGEVGIGFTSNRMAWAYKKGDEIHYGIEHGQHMVDIDPK